MGKIKPSDVIEINDITSLGRAKLLFLSLIFKFSGKKLFLCVVEVGKN